MKKPKDLAKLILAIALALLFVGFLLGYINSKSVHLPGAYADFITGDNSTRVELEVANTPAEREQGLMYRTQLGENNGMLFIFDSGQRQSFWMKNTKIPLDIIFIFSSKIVDIKKNFQPCTTLNCEIYTSAAPARYVIEVSAGFADRHDLKIGQNVSIWLPD